MDCGIPYCHGTNAVTGAPTGCPVNNQIPDWNDLVYRGDWEEAARNLHSTNNFPEVTGRVCPAPCEASCTLNIDDNPVTIKTIECAIADRAIAQGWLKPEPPARKTGKKVAVVGSGPAGMACAQQLARAGHDVHVFEKFAKAGGLLRYGIPDFKMEKHHVDQRVAQMEAEGVTFHYGAHVGVNVAGRQAARRLRRGRAGGRRREGPRPADPRPRAQGHPLRHGVPAAAEPARERRAADGSEPILATGKHVVVIGGGDTGSDCIGTSIRQGALSVTNFEIMPQPPRAGEQDAHLAGLAAQAAHLVEPRGRRRARLRGRDARSSPARTVRSRSCTARASTTSSSRSPAPSSSSTADLVLLAMGFVHPVHEGMIEALGLELDPRGNVKADTVAYQSSNPKVFAGGDMRRGQSLVVWAIREGRQAAHAVDKFLMGATTLPR